MKSNFKAVVAGMGLALAAFGAQAQSYSFSCFAGATGANCNTGAAQLSLTLIDKGTSTDFMFSNIGTLASSITDIYFDWTSDLYALTQGAITDSGAGVEFAYGANPASLPGGNAIGFAADLGADSNSPAAPNGVNPGEFVTFNFNGSLALFQTGIESGGLNVGLHVQAFGDGASQSFVVGTPTVTSPVPEPETYAMMLLGLGVVGFAARRRQQS